MRYQVFHSLKQEVRHWGGWTSYEWLYDIAPGSCPCCHSVITYTGAPDCSECPLFSLWGDNCCSPSSPYDKWENSLTIETRKKYAKIIADECRRLLNEEEQAQYENAMYEMYGEGYENYKD